jgi:hypothetical protein
LKRAGRAVDGGPAHRSRARYRGAITRIAINRVSFIVCFLFSPAELPARCRPG